MPLSPQRAEFAATIFVRECLRQWVKMHNCSDPDQLPMKALCEYPHREQQAIIKAIEKAVEASTGMDEVYRVFLQAKIDASRPPE
jgi:hypothetical protein